MQKMTKLTVLTLLISVLQVGPVSASEAEAQRHNFCLALQAEISTTDRPDIEKIGENLSRQQSIGMPDWTVLTGLFEEGRSLFKKGQVQNNALDVCKNKYEDLEAEAKAKDERRGNSRKVSHRNGTKPFPGLMSFAGVVDGTPEQLELFEDQPEIDDCQDLLNYQNCTKESAEAHDGLLTFYKDWAQKLGFSSNEKKKACDCLSEKLQARYHGNTSSLDKDRDEVQDTLKRAMFGQVKKKFLNDYAAIAENINFYSSAVGTFFGTDPLEQKSKAQLLQCSEAHMFEAAIQNKCGKKIERPRIQKRMDLLFNAYWDGEPGAPLSQKLKALNERILVLDIDGSSKKADGQVYKRFDHDQYRASLSRTDQRYIFMESLVRKAMKISSISERVYKDSKTPYESFSAAIHEYAHANPEEFSKNFLNEKEMGPELYKVFKDALTDDKETPDLNTFKSAMGEAMGIHPGFEQMMRDKSILAKVVPLAESRNKTLTQILETRDSGLAEKFHDQCKKVVSDFAEIICMDEQKVAQALTSEQAIGLITLPDPNKQDILREIMCKAKKPSSSQPSFLTNLLMTNPEEKISDFHERMTVAPDQQKNAFRMLYTHFKNNNTEVIGKLDKSLEITRGQLNSVRGEGLLSNVFGSDYESQSVVKSLSKDGVPTNQNNLPAAEKIAVDQPVVAPTEATEVAQTKSQNHSQVREGTVLPGYLPQVQAPQLNNYASPTYAAAQTVAQATSETKSLRDMKKEFREFLSNESNKENVEKLMSGTDESMMKELMKLRDEYSKNQARLNELTTEHQKLQLKKMEEELSGLENQRAKVLANSNEKSFGNERTQQDNSVVENRREIASIASVIDTGSASGGISSGGGGSAGVSSGKGSLNPAGSAQQAVAAASSLPQSVHSSIDSSPAVIVSSQSAKASGIEIKSNDLSKEVMSYIEKGAVDVNTLVKLKTSGMVYKYKVLENGKVIEKEMVVEYHSLTDDAKKLIDQKIVANGIDLKELEKIDGEMKKLRRSYTYNSLKMLLGEQLRR